MSFDPLIVGVTFWLTIGSPLVEPIAGPAIGDYGRNSAQLCFRVGRQKFITTVSESLVHHDMLPQWYLGYSAGPDPQILCALKITVKKHPLLIVVLDSELLIGYPIPWPDSAPLHLSLTFGRYSEKSLRDIERRFPKTDIIHFLRTGERRPLVGP